MLPGVHPAGARPLPRNAPGDDARRRREPPDHPGRRGARLLPLLDQQVDARDGADRTPRPVRRLRLPLHLRRRAGTSRGSSRVCSPTGARTCSISPRASRRPRRSRSSSRSTVASSRSSSGSRAGSSPRTTFDTPSTCSMSSAPWSPSSRSCVARLPGRSPSRSTTCCSGSGRSSPGRCTSRYCGARSRSCGPASGNRRTPSASILVGPFCEQPTLELLQLVEDVGCYVVGDELQMLHSWYRRVDASADPLESLARAYSTAPVDIGVRSTPTTKAEAILARVEPVPGRRGHLPDGQVLRAGPRGCRPLPAGA